MSKRRNCDRESTQIDKLKREKEQLKIAYAKLRKQIDRLNIDHERYTTLRELLHKQNKEEREAKKSDHKWICHDCGKGHLKIIILPIPGKTKYFRKCDICSKRTKTQIHTSEVEES